MSKEAKKEVNSLQMSVTISLKTESGYPTHSISDISFSKVMQSNTDTPVKEIMREFGDHLEGAYSQSEEDVKVSPHLSDGYHKLSSEEKEDNTF